MFFLLLFFFDMDDLLEGWFIFLLEVDIDVDFVYLGSEEWGDVSLRIVSIYSE